MADNGAGHHDFNPVSEPRNYALSGRIMLSAIIILFAVIIIMACLHVYARWYIVRARRHQIRRARRRTHLVFYIEPDNPTSIVPIPTHGLDPAVLKSLPTFTVEDKAEEVLECTVCLSEFEDGEKGRLLPKCKHCFHVECIDMWFHSHSTCPLCRSPVDSGDVPAEAEVVVESQLEVGPESTQSVGGMVVEEVSVGGSSSSVGGRRKGVDLVGVSIEVPPRRSQSFCFGGSNSDESGPSRSPGFKSPTSRLLSLKRILSREKKSPVPSSSGVVWGRVESSSRVMTPP